MRSDSGKHHGSVKGHSNTIEEANRYMANARKILHKTPIEYFDYKDPKMVSEAAGTAYLAALLSINAYLISIGFIKENLPKSIEHYWDIVIKKIPHNGKLKSSLKVAYQNLHLFAYYQGGTSVKMVKDGIEKCKLIIDMMASSIRKIPEKNGYIDPDIKTVAGEPSVKYKIKHGIRRKKK
ncbi:MAG: DUF5618 family protein [Bacteroidetes bacterium]|nr:DUF5618 family protein [Bacteroidota bacterium]